MYIHDTYILDYICIRAIYSRRDGIARRCIYMWFNINMNYSNFAQVSALLQYICILKYIYIRTMYFRQNSIAWRCIYMQWIIYVCNSNYSACCWSTYVYWSTYMYEQFTLGETALYGAAYICNWVYMYVIQIIQRAAAVHMYTEVHIYTNNLL